MELIESDTFDSLMLQQQFEALKEAVALYNKLADTEKSNATVVAKYATLRAALVEYNEAANAVNAEFQDAATLAFGGIVKTITSLIAALVVALTRGLLGR